MTRRPASRRPPRLETAAPPAPLRGPRPEPSLQDRLVRSRVAGRHARLGRDEVTELMRRVVAGHPKALLGLERFERLTLDEVAGAARASWGWAPRNDAGEPVARIDPERTIEGMRVARRRIAAVAHRGGRIVFATTRPASLLTLYQHLARAAHAEGAEVLSATETGPFRADGRSGRRLWWLDGVAVVTDGAALLGGHGLGAADELLFYLPRPDLVVADRGFAGGALRDGLETVALAGLDATALGVAAGRGFLVTLVPLDDGRPPTAYEPLAALGDAAAADAATARVTGPATGSWPTAS